MVVATIERASICDPSGRISGAELGWCGWGRAGSLGGSDESSAGVQLGEDKAGAERLTALL